MSLYTIFGGRGFIGSEFVKQLKQQGHNVFVPERNDSSIYEQDLGIIIYAAGYGDCLGDPHNVLEANTILLNMLLRDASFEKIIYISSTRVYMNQEYSLEDNDVSVCIEDNRRLFNLTKLTAEEICLKSNKNCLIIRPSNVYGLALNSPLFLPSIIRDAINKKSVNMYVTPSYSKDYIFVGDLVATTLMLINLKKSGIFNIASGQNINAETIANLLIKKTGCEVKWLVDTDTEIFAPINIDKIKSIIDFNPANVINDINDMVENFKLSMAKKHVV